MFGVQYYYVILESNQELNDQEVDSVLSEIYLMTNSGIKYRKDEYRKEINHIWFYLFIRTEYLDEANKLSNLLNCYKLNSKVIDKESYLELINNVL